MRTLQNFARMNFKRKHPQRANLERMIAHSEVARVVGEMYGMTGKTSNLGSCQDINFKFVHDSAEKNAYVIKFTCTSMCNKQEIEFQHEVITYLHTQEACSDVAMPLPLRMNAETKEAINVVEIDNVTYFVRLLKFVQGDILSRNAYFTPEVLFAFGAFVGTITLSLVGFSAVADSELLAVANREIEW